jgi:hypothetical protein
MRQLLKSISAIVGTAILLCACVSGPKYSTIENTIPKLAEGYSRIFFYRTSHFQGAYQPVVYINQEKYGEAYLEGVFFKDVLPGKYKISTSMSQGNEVDLNLTSGDTVYIKFVPRIGFAIYPVLVEPSVGKVEIQDMAYVENPNKLEMKEQEKPNVPSSN